MKQSAVVIFPGRGTYGKDELGYLARHHDDKAAFIQGVDDWRASQNRETVSALDNAKTYSAAKHASSLNASALIYTCALADFAAIDRETYDIVAVCGNSLGWYLTLAGAGAVNEANAIRLVDTMGALMEAEGKGGQLIYPFVGEDWREARANEKAIGEALHAGRTAGEAYLSIRLGGMAVLAGDEAGMTAMEKSLPKAEGRYPFRLARHAAFHTPLLTHVSDAAFDALSADIFEAPQLPMIDGRGAVWTPHGSDLDALYQYTLGHQIIETYDFSKSVEVAVKEFAPDRLILAGPGATLGAPIAQELIRWRWKGLTSKADFSAMQKQDPFLIAMGREDQRKLAV
ncbi:acyl carrier protein [Hyphococcus luteus]|uniref:[acyl-carrier-protein] S-malonyltransferase n=1 Tax=Hyphococcus luteus TaxID=2058213 RepID=A0A2S7K2X5_9PROT|nr:acyl carrier protein [Marinicaulis flavus]PQA86845.1 acyl carrier protein [Marinicaulis flavus]